jgi:hypothetical protein
VIRKHLCLVAHLSPSHLRISCVRHVLRTVGNRGKMSLRLYNWHRLSIKFISGLRRDVDEICSLLGYYAASCGNCLPTFRDNVSVPSARDS